MWFIIVCLIGIIVWLIYRESKTGKGVNVEQKANEIATARFEQWRVNEINKELEIYRTQLTNDYNEYRNQLDEYKNQLDKYSFESTQKMFDEWKGNEIERVKNELSGICTEQANNQLIEWKQKMEKELRQDAIDKSKAVVTGKIMEHFVPYMKGFKYNPKDSRFLGSPTDIIVFDGLDEGNLRQIVFVEVKTNKSSLSAREKQIRNVIQEKKIGYEEVRINTE